MKYINLITIKKACISNFGKYEDFKEKSVRFHNPVHNPLDFIKLLKSMFLCIISIGTVNLSVYGGFMVFHIMIMSHQSRNNQVQPLSFYSNSNYFAIH